MAKYSTQNEQDTATLSPSAETAPEAGAAPEVAPSPDTTPPPASNEPEAATYPESGYITYAGAGEGGEFQDIEGGYRCHVIRDFPVAFGTPDTCITARYAARLVETGQAVYCPAPESAN